MEANRAKRYPIVDMTVANYVFVNVLEQLL